MTWFNTLLQSTPQWILLLLGVVLLVVGGNWLVAGAVGLARRLGMSTLIIGLTIVAMGTSSPELVFNIIASSNGNGGLSFGNVVGSNIANIGLVLAFGAIIAPLVVHSRVVTKELPWLIVVTGAMILLPLIMWQLDIAGRGRAYTWPSGVLFVAAFIVTVVSWFRIARRDQKDPITAEMEQEASTLGKNHSLFRAFFTFLLGLLTLVIGARATEEGAVQVAQTFGLSQPIIGLTVVAIATSLPELATTVMACRHGHTDLAVGNIIGSNLFNIGLVLGVTTIIAPVPLPEFPFGMIDLLAMGAFTVVLVPIVTTGHRISRREGIILLIGYFVYMVLRILVYKTVMTGAS